MLTGSKVSSLVRICIFYRPELTGKWKPHGTEIKFLKFKTEMYRRIELTQYMRKIGAFVQGCLLPDLWSLKCQKWLILCTFCWIRQKINPNLGKIFKCICKVLFGSFRKYYGLCTSELPFSKISTFKDFGIPLLTLIFILFISNIYPQRLTNS